MEPIRKCACAQTSWARTSAKTASTSAVVTPSAYMPVIAKQSGARVIEINPEATQLTDSASDFLIKGKAGEVMRRLVEAVERARD